MLMENIGKGADRDFAKSVMWLHKAAALPPMVGGRVEVGVANAQHVLGNFYMDGLGLCFFAKHAAALTNNLFLQVWKRILTKQ